MKEDRLEVFIGAAVIAVAALFLTFLINRTDASFGQTSNDALYKASFRAVDGIAVGSDVRLAGVKVGSVSAIDLNRDTFRADVSLTVPQDIALPEDSAVIISSEGLLGGNFMEIVPGGSPFTLEPGAQILDTQGSVSLVTLLMRFVTGNE